MAIQDENGNAQRLEFAKKNDRIKTEQGNKRDVLSELHQTSINNKNNTIYKISIDIAKAADGRILLYSLKGK